MGEVDNRGQIGIELTVCWHVKQISSLVSRPCKGQGSDLGVIEIAPANKSLYSNILQRVPLNTCPGVGHTMTVIWLCLK